MKKLFILLACLAVIGILAGKKTGLFERPETEQVSQTVEDTQTEGMPKAEQLVQQQQLDICDVKMAQEVTYLRRYASHVLHIP